MDRPDLTDLVRKWQPRLRLGNWKVTIQYRRIFDMGPQESGNCGWTIENLTAHINLIDPADFDPGLTLPQDTERTVVHELLHLLFAGSKINANEEMERFILEQAITRIADLLVALDRGQPTDTLWEPVGTEFRTTNHAKEGTTA